MIQARARWVMTTRKQSSVCLATNANNSAFLHTFGHFLSTRCLHAVVPNCSVGWGVDGGVCKKCNDTSVSPGGINAVCQACGPELKPYSDSTSCVPGERSMIDAVGISCVVPALRPPRANWASSKCTIQDVDTPLWLEGYIPPCSPHRPSLIRRSPHTHNQLAPTVCAPGSGVVSGTCQACGEGLVSSGGLNALCVSCGSGMQPNTNKPQHMHRR